MIDHAAALRLENEAFDHWEAGQLSEAAELYAQALDLADPDHYTHANLHSQYAGVLDALGRASEALAYHESAVAIARRKEGDDLNVEVRTWRRFLADHLVRHGAPERALEAIAPSLAEPTKGEWLLRSVEAEALVALGRSAEALHAARISLTKAPSPERRAELAERFVKLGLQTKAPPESPPDHPTP